MACAPSPACQPGLIIQQQNSSPSQLIPIQSLSTLSTPLPFFKLHCPSTSPLPNLGFLLPSFPSLPQHPDLQPPKQSHGLSPFHPTCTAADSVNHRSSPSLLKTPQEVLPPPDLSLDVWTQDTRTLIIHSQPASTAHHWLLTPEHQSQKSLRSPTHLILPAPESLHRQDPSPIATRQTPDHPCHLLWEAFPDSPTRELP